MNDTWTPQVIIHWDGLAITQPSLENTAYIPVNYLNTNLEDKVSFNAGDNVMYINWALWPISDNSPNRRDKFYKRKNKGPREVMDIVVCSFPSLCIFSSS